MKFLGYVSGEGGPLVLADAVDLQCWAGVDGTAYELACAFLDQPGNEEGGNLLVDSKLYFLWELRGGGTGDIYRIDERRHMIVRMWPHDPDSESGEFAELPRQEGALQLGTLRIESGFMAILWAPVNGDCIQNIEEGRPSGSMAIDDGGWIIRCSVGGYSIWYDEAETLTGNARRCWIEYDGA